MVPTGLRRPDTVPVAFDAAGTFMLALSGVTTGSAAFGDNLPDLERHIRE